MGLGNLFKCGLQSRAANNRINMVPNN